MSREQILIAKEHIRSYTYKFIFGLTRSILRYFSDKTGILSVTLYKPVCVCKLRNAHGMPTFKTKVLRIVTNVQQVKGLLL